MTKTYQLETLTCPTCVAKIERAVKSQPSVDTVEVLFNASKVKVKFNRDDQDQSNIAEVIENLGYKVISES